MGPNVTHSTRKATDLCGTSPLSPKQRTETKMKGLILLSSTMVSAKSVPYRVIKFSSLQLLKKERQLWRSELMKKEQQQGVQSSPT
eukprot:6973846-Ditylum_brightwellii.AAC.1